MDKDTAGINDETIRGQAICRKGSRPIVPGPKRSGLWIHGTLLFKLQLNSTLRSMASHVVPIAKYHIKHPCCRLCILNVLYT